MLLKFDYWTRRYPSRATLSRDERVPSVLRIASSLEPDDLYGPTAVICWIPLAGYFAHGTARYCSITGSMIGPLLTRWVWNFRIDFSWTRWPKYTGWATSLKVSKPSHSENSG